jgi:hypothetical protein
MDYISTIATTTYNLGDGNFFTIRQAIVGWAKQGETQITVA